MMRFFTGCLLLLFAAGPAFAGEGDGDSFGTPVKRVERFTGTRTDPFEDSDGDGLNDLRSKGSEKKSPLKGLLDAIQNRTSKESEREDSKPGNQPSPSAPKDKTKSTTPSTKKSNTDSETKSSRSNSKPR